MTNPNTCGLFERDIIEIADAVHEAGAYFYCDGANFNAIVGRVRPGDLGVDAMHINLHKTFSTPHGGGGPGAGPVVLSQRARALRAGAVDRRTAPTACALVEEATARPPQAFGRMCAFHGQMGMFVRAFAYMLQPRRRRPAPGRRGCGAQRQLHQGPACRRDERRPSATAPACTRRCSTTPGSKGTGVTTLDFAKAMIDEGFHPMTMYFPLVVHGAMLIEPTETESQASLDRSRDAARPGRGGEARRCRALQRRALLRRAAGWTKPRRPASPC